jgi:hypothetical protein
MGGEVVVIRSDCEEARRNVWVCWANLGKLGRAV